MVERIAGWIGMALALSATACLTVEFPGLGRGPLRETVVFGEEGEKILLLDVDGVLSERSEEGALGLGERESIVSRVREQLEMAGEDEHVRALIVRIHSPGGTAGASEMIHGEILRWKEKTGAPVVAQLMGVAASGGYYVAMAADTVQAYPTTVTGSIGVVFAGVNLAGLMEKLGVADQTLTTGPFKDAGSPLRPMSDAEREQLTSVLDDLFVRFLEVVAAGRPGLDRAQVEALADGRIYSARQARDAGLIDAIGDLPAAVEEAKARAGLEEARVIVYHRPGERAENLFSMQAPRRGASGWDEVRAALARPAFLYLWWPGEL